MDDTNSLIEQRKAKLAALKGKGIDPFRNKFTPDSKCNDAHSGFESGKLPEGHRVSVAGRITAHREMGKSIFVDVRDQSGGIQIYAQKNAIEEKTPGGWDVFTHLDLGDFIGVNGRLFRTKTGEPSIKLESFTILAKALRPPPAKWHGLEDTEIRYRQRYLDLIGNPEVKEVFLKRSAIVHEIRTFFHNRGYVEVETPAMQAIPGGAAAQPLSPLTTRSAASFICASRWSCITSGCSWAASTSCSRLGKTSATKDSHAGTIPCSRCSKPTARSAIAPAQRRCAPERPSLHLDCFGSCREALLHVVEAPNLEQAIA